MALTETQASPVTSSGETGRRTVTPMSDDPSTTVGRAAEGLKQGMIADGLVTKKQLRTAEGKAQHEGGTLSNALVELGYVTQEQLASFIGEKIHVPYVSIADYDLDPQVLELIPEMIARRYRVLPLFKIENVLTIAMSDPLDVVSLDDMAAVAGCQVEPVIASEESIGAATDEYYKTNGNRSRLVEQLAEELREPDAGEESPYAEEVHEIRLKEEASEPLIIKLVNSYIAQAMLEGVSDIHFEPRRDHLSVRFRLDGFLFSRDRLPARLIPLITSRIKIMAQLDIANSRVPQDGRIGLTVGDRGIDIRASTYPCMFGENVVLRILDETEGTLLLPALGLADENLKRFGRLISAGKGIILATGPTGSGKTTTIYSALNAIERSDKNVMTVEDPIEYEIDNAVQSQVNPKAGVTFAGALRSILRQDPDIIYVGEIRDLETAEIAVRAALTGHLVLSTLHTNDAVGAITRFSDIGVRAGFIESALNGALAQRLVRRICPKCTTEYAPREDVLERYGLPTTTTFHKGTGCPHCSGIGYRGRVGIFEVLVVNKTIRALIREKASEDTITEAARQAGMTSLLEDGLAKVAEGITTLEEIQRATDTA